MSNCAASNLTYNQYLSGSALYYPLPGMDIDPIDSSYVKTYANWTAQTIPVEAFYFSARSGQDFPAEITVDDVYQSLNLTGLYNPTIYQDVLLGYNIPLASNVFTQP